MTIEYTSSMRGTIAKMWIDPERDINKFFDLKCNDNYSQIKNFINFTIKVPSDEQDDFMMDYFESLVKLVWPTEEIDGKKVSTSNIFYSEDDSDQEFLRRVKNRLWSFCTSYLRKKSNRPDMFVSLYQQTPSTSESSEYEYMYDVCSDEDIERSLIGNQTLTAFIKEFESLLNEQLPEENKEEVIKAAKRQVLGGMYNKEAILTTKLKTWEYSEGSKIVEEILEKMKPNYF